MDAQSIAKLMRVPIDIVGKWLLITFGAANCVVNLVPQNLQYC